MDTFYPIHKLSRDKQVKILHEAHAICDNWWLDKLDCRESFARQLIEGATFEEALSHFTTNAYSTMIFRRPTIPIDKPHFEVGFRSMESPIDYFLWIIISPEKGDCLIKMLD